MLLGKGAGSPPPESDAMVTRVERKSSAAGATTAPAVGEARQAAPEPSAPPAEGAQTPSEQVVADAVRLVQWGRKWFELPELIARMAGRPPLAEVRRILKTNRAAIDSMSGQR